MSKITYANKTALNENTGVADANKVNASDMNEIKTVVNANDDTMNAMIVNEQSNSTTNTYSCDYINKIGKKLWEGNFTSGDITVPNLSEYTAIAVNLDGVLCFGNRFYGSCSVMEYGQFTFNTYGYRLAGTGTTMTIDSYNKGGSNGSANVAITEIYGLF